MGRNRRRGSAMIEFILAGIPTILIIVSCVELGRGMWTYHNLANAVNATNRYISVHGKGCSTGTNSCTIRISDLVTKFVASAPGLTAASLNVTFTSASSSVECNPLSSCSANTTVWPPTAANTPGQDIKTSVTYNFRSGMAIFWPGVSGVKFGVVNLPATARQRIMF
jgi:Flp pilus assembly protein TadG